MLSVSRRFFGDKFFVIVAFVLILLVIAIIVTTPLATGYEISIYDAYPAYFWIFIIFSIFCGILILVKNAFSDKRSKYCIFGFAILLATNLIILLLPIFRGYATSRMYDVLTHIGYIKDILITGNFGNDYYPATHILGASLSDLTGLRPELIVLLLPTFFFCFYMISLYLLSRVICQNFGQALLITAFGSLLIFGDQSSMFFPTLQCFQLVPFILYLLIKMNKIIPALRTCSLLLVIMLIAVPLYHPGEGTLFLLAIFTTFAMLPFFIRVLKTRYENIQFYNMKSGRVIMIIFILLISWFVWFSTSIIFTGNLAVVWNWVAYHIGQPALQFYFQNASDIIARTNMTLFQLIDLFIKMYGQLLLYFSASLFIILFMSWKFFFKRRKANFIMVTAVILFISVGVVTLAFVMMYPNVSLTRNLNWLIFASALLNGVGFYSLFKLDRKRMGTFIVALFLAFVIILGVFNTFPSPITRNVYFQVTNMELTGNNWFLEHQNEEINIISISFAPLRFAQEAVGNKGLPINLYEGPVSLPPAHFGYTNNTFLGTAFLENKYFIDSKLSRINPIVFPEYVSILSFTPEDFYHLDYNDHSVNRIFSNGEFWVYYIYGM